MRGFSEFDRLETADSSEARHAQKRLFAKHLTHIANNSRFYKNLFKREGIDVAKIGLDDLPSLPFTSKSDLEMHNGDFLSVSPRDVADIVLSSGTTGKATRIMYSENDMARLAYNEKIALSRAGITADDVVLLTCTLDRCFVAGQAYYSGLRAIGAASIRNGHSNIDSHMEIVQNMAVSAIVGVPSFLRKLGAFLREQGKYPVNGSVKRLICIGEPIRNGRLALHTLGKALEEVWNAKVFSTYASSETVTTFCECSAQKGGHLHPALGYVEVIGDSGLVLPAGEVGEVVVTPFLVEGMPLLRFRTGDISFLMDEPCDCGRSSVRLGPILGRTKEMIKMNGTTVYPQSIFTVLDEIEHVTEYYVIASSDYELSDSVDVRVSVNDSTCDADYISSRLQARLRVRPSVTITSEKETKEKIYNAKARKPVRFFDQREIKSGM